jgi:aspartate/methionine/tyrosine aminotransferase
MTWEHEKILVRDDIPGGFNLAVGDPEVLRACVLPRIDDKDEVEFYSKLNNGYPSLDAPYWFKEAVYEQNIGFHKYVIPTHGAKHALHAALYALTVDSPVKKTAFFPRPYWVSYPAMAEAVGIEIAHSFSYLFEHEVFGREDIIEIMASPNNPDGHIFRQNYEPDIWDAAYASSAYGWKGENYDAKIVVCSAGKLTGNVNLRVGWLMTDDADLAEKAKRYVEQTTSGVSSLAMAEAVVKMRAVTPTAKEGFFKHCRDTSELIGNELVDMGFNNVSYDKRGMFAWMQVKDFEKLDWALAEAKVSVLKGTACGAIGPGYYRWSLGKWRSYTEDALKQLKDCVK